MIYLTLPQKVYKILATIVDEVNNKYGFPCVTPNDLLLASVFPYEVEKEGDAYRVTLKYGNEKLHEIHLGKKCYKAFREAVEKFLDGMGE